MVETRSTAAATAAATAATAAAAATADQFPRWNGGWFYPTKFYAVQLRNEDGEWKIGKIFNGPSRKPGESDESWKERTLACLKEAKEVCKRHNINCE